MTRYPVFYAACAFQTAGLLLLRHSGLFAPGRPQKPFARPGGWIGSALYGGGCLAMILFALYERHFLLLAGQIACTALVALGAAPRKPA